MLVTALIVTLMAHDPAIGSIPKGNAHEHVTARLISLSQKL